MTRIGDARRAVLGMAAAIAVAASVHAGITPVGTNFTYQGQLRNAGGPINGTASARFRLFNQAAGGSQVGGSLTACGLTLVDGLFTVDLDFGFSVFDGSERWLEISVQSPASDCATFTVLAPRQQLTPAPYAIRSLAPWETNGNFVFYNTGGVGIGTNAPATDLEISKANATMRLTSTAVNGTSTLDLKGDAPSGLGSNVLGSLRFLDETNAVRAEMSSSLGLFANAFNFAVDGVVEMALTGTGNLGVGTTLPVAKLQLVGGTDSEPGTGGFLVIGATNDANLSMDNNEIMARNNGAVSTLFLNNDGGGISMCSGGGQVTVGPIGAAAELTVYNSLFVNGGAQPRIDVGPNGFILMDTGADITITNGGLEVNTPSGGSTFFNRTASDGTLISFYNNGLFAGGIAVFGSTVSYNTFTGSHNAWTETPIEPGTLVTLTGRNQRDHAGANCEPTYGVAPTTVANDSRCLGSYLGAPDPSDPASHHLVASVGNGEMWVVDSGHGDIEPGDALISSDVVGCAMQDDTARFMVGHVVARAAEPVEWAAVHKGPDGVKRVLLSVLYDRFERQGDAAALAGTVESLRAENDELRARLQAIEAQLATLARSTEGGRR
ncbi:MAG: hypothetical protein U0575_15165 [Phycisphaerales bacterium]